MKKIRENFLVTSGNQAIYPPGLAVFNPDVTRKGPTINVAPGQLVIYDPITNLSLGPLTLNKTDYGRVVMGVAYDTNGDGLSDVIRKSFGDIVYGCHIYSANAKPPRCGVPGIQDIFFSCTDFGTDYTINVNVEDWRTQDQYPFNRPSQLTLSAKTTDITPCDSCGDTHECSEVARLLVESFNNLKRTGAFTDSNGILNRLNPLDYDFDLVQLYANSFRFCITPESPETCANCISTGEDPIRGISYSLTDGGDTVYYEFPGADLLVGADDFALVAQLQIVVDRINAFFAATGTVEGNAVLIKGTGKCCPYQIEINTTAFDVELLVEANDSEADIDDWGTQEPCEDDTDTFGDSGFTCGLRFITHAVDYDCDCFPPNQPIKYFGRDLKIFPVSGFHPASYLVAEAQAQVLPDGLGYHFQWRDYVSDNGGEGRTHNSYNDHYGPILLPGKNDRARATVVDCNTPYCSYAFGQRMPNFDRGPIGMPTVATGRTIVLIPSADTATRTSFEAAINAYITEGVCNALPSISCTEG